MPSSRSTNSSLFPSLTLILDNEFINVALPDPWASVIKLNLNAGKWPTVIDGLRTVSVNCVCDSSCQKIRRKSGRTHRGFLRLLSFNRLEEVSVCRS